jgi:hypothetical protein
MLLVNINFYMNFGVSDVPFAIVQASFIENRIWPDIVYGL